MVRLGGLLFSAAIITVVYQFSFFILATVFKFEKLTQLAGGSNFVVLAMVSLLLSKYYEDSCTPRQIVASTLVMVWGARISIFLFYRMVVLFRKDRRFGALQESPCVFLGIWVMHMAWVFIVSLPVLVLNAVSKSCSAAFGATDLVGVAVAIVGLAMEAWADHVKLHFRMTVAEERWCDEGPWKYSRHPNYFGEMLFWWGVFVTCASCFHGSYYSTAISPLFAMLLLLCLSGMPLLEREANAQWRQSQDFLEYREETSPLIPLPRGFYAGLPMSVKRECRPTTVLIQSSIFLTAIFILPGVFLFEWSMYEAGLLDDRRSLVDVAAMTIIGDEA